ncbi:putative zinc-containing alcohol dehydrogenase [Gordonia hirsuta DSM 44140 = NBRC 16056]|uniref:Putative zinc-containing alcohol dehydrogenase n=1 Tax=Gordonia hirsuta DSM 44140 = NBRC 16056 TaxID=1121927 RepID=L7LC50_9ACTN|nr:alcohol dehydrogenase catalytic domain-containing protein [Gordonia hirsuta]GAC58710.1 putative zinc-containing alcohol dehydrogenase [Gordonia hirsuta DSM 44140 = NBRC 16056]
MRELMYTGRWQAEWRESPDPVIDGPGQAVVAPVAATTCDVDTQILAGHGPIPAPFAIGHECVARVVEVADDVTAVQPGQLVVVPWAINCGTCEQCLAGHTSHCTSVPYMAMYGAPIGGEWGGLFSDLVKVPYADAMLVPLLDGLDPIAMASASDNWSLAWRLVAPHLKRMPGASVMVVARGSIGLYVCDIARALGASDVLFVSPIEEHRALAETFGARAVAETGPVDKGFDLAIEATGRVDQLAVAATSIKPEGFCESAGNHFRPGELPLFQMYLNSMSLRIARDNVRPNIPAALELAASGQVDPRAVVSDVFDWEELPERIVERHAKPVFVRDLQI